MARNSWQKNNRSEPCEKSSYEVHCSPLDLDKDLQLLKGMKQE